jgi:PAS domain-containing protein
MPKRLNTGLTGSVLTAERSSPSTPRAEMMQLLDGAAFGAVFESSGEALVVVDLLGAVRRANRRTKEMLRFTEARDGQKNLADFISVPSESDLRSWCKQSFTLADSEARSSPHSLDGAFANGFPLRVTLRSVLPGSGHLLLCIEDGVLAKRSEERTNQLEAELSSLLDALEAGVILFDPMGHIRFANARFGQLFGLNLQGKQVIQTIGELESLVAPRFRNSQAFSMPWRQFAAGEETPSQDELELVRPARRVLERYSRPVLSRDGPSAGWMELYYDVTAKREIQSKLLQTEKWRRSGSLSLESRTN